MDLQTEQQSSLAMKEVLCIFLDPKVNPPPNSLEAAFFPSQNDAISTQKSIMLK